MRLLYRVFAPLFALLLLSGCLMTSKIGGVVIQVAELAPISSTQLVATLSFTNENVVAIGVTRANYKLYLNGKLVAKAVNENAVGLPQLGVTKQKVIFKIENPELLRQMVSTAQGNQASYKLDGQLSVYSGEDKIEINSADTGAVSLKALEGKL